MIGGGISTNAVPITAHSPSRNLDGFILSISYSVKDAYVSFQTTRPARAFAIARAKSFVTNHVLLNIASSGLNFQIVTKGSRAKFFGTDCYRLECARLWFKKVCQGPIYLVSARLSDQRHPFLTIIVHGRRFPPELHVGSGR